MCLFPVSNKTKKSFCPIHRLHNEWQKQSLIDDYYMTTAITNLQQETAALDSKLKCKTSRQ